VAVRTRRARILSPSARNALEKLRRICAAFGDCEAHFVTANVREYRCRGPEQRGAARLT
jgi:hypothetical protein